MTYKTYLNITLSFVLLFSFGLNAGGEDGSSPKFSPGEWPAYGSTIASTKYSPLSQINAENFSKLQVAWSWTTADTYFSSATPDGGTWTAQGKIVFDQLNEQNPDRWRGGEHPRTGTLKATPLMVGGVLYLG